MKITSGLDVARLLGLAALTACPAATPPTSADADAPSSPRSADTGALLQPTADTATPPATADTRSGGATADTAGWESTAHTGIRSDTGAGANPGTTADTAANPAITGDTAGSRIETASPARDTGPTCPEPGVVVTPWFDEFGSRGPVALDRLADGRVLATTHGRNDYYPSIAKVTILSMVPPLGRHYLGTNYQIPSEGRILGQSSAVLGDTNGDGWEDIVASVFAEPPLLGPVLEHAVVFYGRFQPNDSQSAPPDGTALDAVGWRFARCDVNADGLADVCSTRGIALSPPPFSNASTFADGAPADRVVSAPMGWDDGLVFYRATSATLQFVPFASLPPAGQASSSLATHTSAIEDRVLALSVGDIHPDPGIELVATVERDGMLGVVAWGLAPGFPERARWMSCHPADAQGALALGDFDLDGQLDAAAASLGRLAVLRGPLHPSAEVTWWTGEHDWVDPAFPFAYSLLAWSDGDLLVGWPGYLRDTLIPPNGGYPAPDAYGGVLYRLSDPLAP